MNSNAEIPVGSRQEPSSGMDEYKRIAGCIIDMVCDAAEKQHPEIKLVSHGTYEDAVICGVKYYELEEEIAEFIETEMG